MNIFAFLFRRKRSGTIAKERLQSVLMQDRSALPSNMLEALRAELIRAISKHVRVDKDEVQVSITRAHKYSKLVINAPFRPSRKQRQAYMID